MVIQLINFTGLDSHQHWNNTHPAPSPCADATLGIQFPRQPAQVVWDCPEQNNGPQILQTYYSDGMLTVKIPQIHFTGLIVIHE
jgi:hypothetical protein